MARPERARRAVTMQGTARASGVASLPMLHRRPNDNKVHHHGSSYMPLHQHLIGDDRKRGPHQSNGGSAAAFGVEVDK
jgi:hypothetical protein